MIIFRDFLFLDTNTLQNYLSTLDGHFEEELDYSEFSKEQKSAKADAKFIGGDIASEKASETKSKRTLPPPAQFQKLCDALDELNQVQYLDAFDAEIWDEIERGEILEIQATITVPNLLHQMEIISEFTGFAEGLPFVKESLEESFEGFTEVKNKMELKPVPLIFRAASTPGYKFVADLSRDFIKCNLRDLQGEAVVFGKVQRILKKGQKLEAFSAVPDVSSMPNLNREQRRKLQSNKKKANQKNLVEVVHGPAIVITPIAVYR